MKKKVPLKRSDEELYQLSKGELVQFFIKTLQFEIARLKQIVSKDSKTSSKPPSQDIIKKSEKKPETQDSSSNETPVKQLENWVKTKQPNVHVDETPWAVKGVKES